MKLLIFIAVLALMAWTFQTKKTISMQDDRTFYEHTIQTIDGVNFDLSSLKGKKLLVVNVASECGLTPQYKELQELYDEFGGEGFEILGFPANNFGSQEPGSHSEIVAFCEKNYGVTFQIFEKISVKGDDQHPIYQWLTRKELNSKKSVSVKWNFQKFLIDEEGNWVDYLLPTTSPKSEKLTQWLQN